MPKTSYNCHQDISSPTSAINIVVTILSIKKPVGNVPWGRLDYYEKEKKIGSQFKAVHEKIFISGCHGQDTETIWNIGGIQNIKRTDEAREIRRNIGNGIYLNWSEVRFFDIFSKRQVFSFHWNTSYLMSKTGTLSDWFQNLIKNDTDGSALAILNESAMPIYIESSLNSLKTSKRVVIIRPSESSNVFEMKDFSGKDLKHQKDMNNGSLPKISK